jgi:AcrR family transcriptional regulator
MGRRPKVTRQAISDSAVRLVVQQGTRNATMRAISAGMAVNEAALYRHYKSKDEILASAYVGIVEEMAREKQHLAKSALPFRDLAREWIKLTYLYFDKNPDAFAYVLLLPPPSPVLASGITRVQGKLFLSLLRRALRNKEIRPIPAKLAYSHFSAIMLNIPRLLREGTLRGRAVHYVDDATDAVWRVLAAEAGSRQRARIG